MATLIQRGPRGPRPARSGAALPSEARVAGCTSASVVSPVTFPPGRARLATRPVPVKLADLLNKDFEAVLDLCEQQAAVWRQQRALPKDQRAQWERETKRLEGAINRLLDQIEAGQAVGAVVPNLWGLAVGPSPTEGCCDGRAKAHGWRRRQLACAQYMSPSSQIWPGLRPRSAHLELAYGPGRSPRPVHKVLLVSRNPPA